MPLGRKPLGASISSDVTGFMMGGRRLVMLKNGVAEKAYIVGMEPFGIGRDKTNHIPIEDGLSSKFHARIIPKQSRVEVQDVDSRNGTRVNERLMVMQWINPGDVIRIGRTCFIYLMEGMPLKRRPEEVTGLLRSSEPGGPTLPVTQFPLLFGKAPEADHALPGLDVHFHSQVVSIPGGAQVTNLVHDPPQVTLLTDGTEVAIGRQKFTYRAAHGDTGRPASDASVMRMLEEEADRVDRAVPMPGTGLDPAAAFAISPHKVGGCHITGTKGSLTGKTFAVIDRAIFMGSDPNCDIVINNRAVSRRHARLSRKEGEPIIEDISNTIGVYVNGVRVHRHPLKPGDVIAIATDEFMVHL